MPLIYSFNLFFKSRSGILSVQFKELYQLQKKNEFSKKISY